MLNRNFLQGKYSGLGFCLDFEMLLIHTEYAFLVLSIKRINIL